MKEVTKNSYERALENHMQGVDITNNEEVFKRVDSLKTYSVKINTLKAVHYKTKDKEILRRMKQLDCKYKAEILNKPIDKIDWEKIVDRLSKNRLTRDDDMAYILVLLCQYHPRRYTDVFMISVKDDGKSNNYYNGETIKFNISKNETGETEIVLHPKVKEELDKYIKKYDITDSIWGSKNYRGLRYLFQKYKIPLTNHNRKFQETSEIKEGVKNHLDIANKFNHTIETQLVFYKKEIV